MIITRVALQTWLYHLFSHNCFHQILLRISNFINHYYASSLPPVYYSSGLLTWSFLISSWFLVTTHY